MKQTIPIRKRKAYSKNKLRPVLPTPQKRHLATLEVLAQVSKALVDNGKSKSSLPAVVQPTLELLLIADREIFSRDTMGLDRENALVFEASAIRKEQLKNPQMVNSEVIREVVGKTLNTIQQDGSQMDWRQVCKPLPPRPRLPTIPAGSKYSVNLGSHLCWQK